MRQVHLVRLQLPVLGESTFVYKYNIINPFGATLNWVNMPPVPHFFAIITLKKPLRGTLTY